MTDEAPYSKREMDMYMKNQEHTLSQIERQVGAFVETQTKTNENFENDIKANQTAIKLQANTAKVAYWAFGITIPVVLAMGIFIFFNEIKHLQAQLTFIIPNDKQTNETDK